MVKPPKVYAANEKVLCNHQGRMYEAKILDVKLVEGVPQYFVHYQGWNNRWDEWVADDRLEEFSEENLKKQQEAQEPAKPRSSGGKTGTSQRSRASMGEGADKSRSHGGKSKSTTGSSGPSTPFDGQSGKTGSNVNMGDTPGGLELESRASTPSVDGSASVTSTSTTGQPTPAQPASTKRKAPAKSKAAANASLASTPAPADVSQSAQSDQPETPVSAEPKRKRARPSAASSSATSGMQPPATTVPAVPPSESVNPAPDVESFDQFRGRQEIQVKMPDDLKEVIVDDWDKVTRQMRICTLPAAKTIDDILNDYAKQKGNQKGLPAGKQYNIRETVEGIRAYFNAMCGVHLLYKFERPQYNDILEQQLQQDENEESSTSADEGPNADRRSRLTAFYGFPHLLRLFVRMGNMLAYTDLDQKSIDAILGWIQELMKFLSKHKTTYYRPDDDYFVTTAEYQRKAFAN